MQDRRTATTDRIPRHVTFMPEGVSGAELYRQMTTGQASDFLGIPKRNLEAMRQHGTGPVFVRFSARNVRYRVIDLIRYQESRLRRSTLDDGLTQEAAA